VCGVQDESSISGLYISKYLIMLCTCDNFSDLCVYITGML